MQLYNVTHRATGNTVCMGCSLVSALAQLPMSERASAKRLLAVPYMHKYTASEFVISKCK